jgi:phage shock protein C
MYCTQCGRELRDDDRFCSGCGLRAQGSKPASPPPALMLDKANKKVAGVCAGFARYFDTDVTLMRVLWLGIALCTGVGFLAYLAAWIVLPSDANLRTDNALARV